MRSESFAKMKFRTLGSGSAKKEPEQPSGGTKTATHQHEAGSKGSVARNDGGSAVPATRPRSLHMEEFVTHSRKSVEDLSSPRHGRPSNLLALDVAKATGVEFAFQVPDTPPAGSLGKHVRFPEKSTFSLNNQDEGVPSVTALNDIAVPFPLVEDDSARHKVCQDSLLPWTYLLAIPGKNVRDTLIDAFNEWLRCSASNLAVIKQVVGYLHTGSLIIDDIEDESATRRGEPAAHMVYGVARSLNAGNYVYFLAMEKVLTLQCTECVMVFTNEMLNLHRGQGRDIFWRTTMHIASEEEYCQMVCDKTGGLFRLAIRFMQILSPLMNTQTPSRARKATSASFASDHETPGTPGRMMSPSVFTATSDFTTLADQMACYFQIRDDLINLASPNFHQKKGFCEDITEGKLSFIALHSLRTYKAKNKKKEMDELMGILQAKTEDKKVMKRALALMDDTKSFDYTVKYLKDLYDDIEESIKSLGKNPKLLQLMETIASEVKDCYDVRKRVIDTV